MTQTPPAGKEKLLIRIYFLFKNLYCIYKPVDRHIPCPPEYVHIIGIPPIVVIVAISKV